MLVLKILAAYGGCILLFCLFFIIRFRHQLGQFLRSQFLQIDYPVWMYRLRRWWRTERQQIRNRREQIGGILFVITVFSLLALGLIVSCPS